jgi:hypothetical protein
VKLCTRARILAMQPDGTVAQLELIDIGRVGDDHEFGVWQETIRTIGHDVATIWPVLHIEGILTAYPTEDSTGKDSRHE